MVSIATTFVKLVQTILCYVAVFVMCQSVSVFLCIFKRDAFYVIMALCHIHLPISYFVIVSSYCLTITIITIVITISYCQQLFYLTVSLFTFTEKFDCGRANHVVSTISSATTFIKLWQMIYQFCDVTFSIYLQKNCISHHNGFMSHTPHFRRKTWSSSHYEELEKKSRRYLNLRGTKRYFTQIQGDLKFKGGELEPSRTSWSLLEIQLSHEGNSFNHKNLLKAELKWCLNIFQQFFIC